MSGNKGATKLPLVIMEPGLDDEKSGPTHHSEKRVYWLVAAGCVCLLLILAGILAPVLVLQHVDEVARQARIANETNIAEYWSSVFRQSVVDAMSVAFSVEGFVLAQLRSIPPLHGTVSERVHDQYFDKFESLVEMLNSSMDDISKVILAPGGVLYQVVPNITLDSDSTASSPDDLYFDFLVQNYSGGLTPMETVERGVYAVLGPSKVYQDPSEVNRPWEWVIDVRQPVFNVTNNDDHDDSNFWGFVYVVLSVNSMLESKEFDRHMRENKMDYLVFSDLPTGVLNVSSSLDNYSTPEEYVMFINSSTTRSVLPLRLHLSLSVHAKGYTLYSTKANMVIICCCAVFGSILLFAIAAIIILHCTREYDGRRYAAKSAPFAVLTLGACHGADLWDLAPDQMVDVNDKLNKLLTKQMVANHAYQITQLHANTVSFTLRTVDAAVRMAFGVIEDLQTHPIDEPLIRLLGDDGQLLMSYAIHWCTDAQVSVDQVANCLRYSGPDVMYSGRMWVFAAPNTVTLSAPAKDVLSLNPTTHVIVKFNSVFLRGVAARQDLFTVRDLNSRRQEEAVKGADEHIRQAHTEAARRAELLSADSNVATGGPFDHSSLILHTQRRHRHHHFYEGGGVQLMSGLSSPSEAALHASTSDSSGDSTSSASCDPFGMRGGGGGGGGGGGDGTTNSVSATTSAAASERCTPMPIPNPLRPCCTDYIMSNLAGGGGGDRADGSDSHASTSTSDPSANEPPKVTEDGRYFIPRHRRRRHRSRQNSRGSNTHHPSPPHHTDVPLHGKTVAVDQLDRPNVGEEGTIELALLATEHAAKQTDVVVSAAANAAGRVQATEMSSSSFSSFAAEAAASSNYKATLQQQQQQQQLRVLPIQHTDSHDPLSMQSNATPTSTSSTSARAESTPSVSWSASSAGGGSSGYGGGGGGDRGNGLTSVNGVLVRLVPRKRKKAKAITHIDVPRMTPPPPAPASLTGFVMPDRLQTAVTHVDGTAAPTSVPAMAIHVPPMGQNGSGAVLPAPMVVMTATTAAAAAAVGSDGGGAGINAAAGNCVRTPSAGAEVCSGLSSPPPPMALTVAGHATVSSAVFTPPLAPAASPSPPPRPPVATVNVSGAASGEALPPSSVPTAQASVSPGGGTVAASVSGNSASGGSGEVGGGGGGAVVLHPTHAIGIGALMASPSHSGAAYNDDGPLGDRLAVSSSGAQYVAAAVAAAEANDVQLSVAFQLLHPSIPVWLNTTLRTAYESHAFDVDFSYDSVRVIVYFFFTGFKLLFKPLAAQERANIYGRLVTAFGIPRQNTLEHLAARCTIRLLQQLKEEKALMWSK